jgi:hypothetical protein
MLISGAGTKAGANGESSNGLSTGSANERSRLAAEFSDSFSVFLAIADELGKMEAIKLTAIMMSIRE